MKTRQSLVVDVEAGEDTHIQSGSDRRGASMVTWTRALLAQLAGSAGDSPAGEPSLRYRLGHLWSVSGLDIIPTIIFDFVKPPKFKNPPFSTKTALKMIDFVDLNLTQ